MGRTALFNDAPVQQLIKQAAKHPAHLSIAVRKSPVLCFLFGLQVAPIGLLQAAQALSDGDSDAAYAAAAAHAGCSCSGVLHLVAEQSG